MRVSGPTVAGGDDRRFQIEIEEYRNLVEERRFIMKQYMQAVLIYLALIGYTLKELMATAANEVFITLASILVVAILFGFYAAGQFKSMAYHAIEREKYIAARLQVQPPHGMLWGYVGGVMLLIAGLVAVSAVTLHRFGGALAGLMKQ